MDIDPKCFFENPPRMKEDLKEYMRKLAESVVFKIVTFSKRLFPNERLFCKHIKLAILAISPDPITIYNRNGLCVQNVKLKPICKVLCKAIDNATSCLDDNKYGNTDRKIYRSCARMLKQLEVKTNNSATVALTAVISQVCGILMQSSLENSGSIKTLTLETVEEKGIKHKTTSGDMIPYSSFIRFLHMITNFEPSEYLLKCKPKKQECKSLSVKHVESLEMKPKVSFQQRASTRPSTPSHCFWEDDE